jgi:hypothetical protein
LEDELQRVLDSLDDSFNTDDKEDSVGANGAKVEEEVKIEAMMNAIRAKARTISPTVNYAATIERASFNLIGSLLLTFEALDRWGKRFKVMLDCGSTHNWVDSQWVKSQGITSKLARPIRVEFANGEEASTSEYTKILARLGTHRLTVQAMVMPLPGDIDMVLGMPWLKRFNPDVDWIRSTIKVHDRNGTHEIQALDDERRTDQILELKLISARGVKESLKKKNTECIIFHLRQPVEDASLDAILPKDVPPEYQKIIRHYADRFRTELPEELPPDRGFKHSIDTGDAKPTNVNAYPLSYSQIEEQMAQIQDLLSKGLIRTSSSPWGSPVLFIKKPEGKWRMCIDYRALNSITEKNTYPLPRIQEYLDRIGKSIVISKINLTAGFNQVRIAKDSI